MTNYVAAVEHESLLFDRTIRSESLDAPVPSCPGWNVADLVWHLIEVQHFWASIVVDLLTSPDGVTKLERPPNRGLPDLLSEQTARLMSGLALRDADESCYSWHDEGRNVGWVRRRQAHEALIHRLDAELAAGTESPVDPTLAADGVDEILSVLMDIGDVPAWGTFAEDARRVRLDLTDVEGSWTLGLGHFSGRDPATKAEYDRPVIRLLPPIADADIAISGSAVNVDRWLWGRGNLERLNVVGDREVALRIRAAAVESTQ